MPSTMFGCVVSLVDATVPLDRSELGVLVGKDLVVSSPGMTGSVFANKGFGCGESREGVSSWDSTGGSNSSKQYPSKGSRRGGGLGISSMQRGSKRC